MPPFLATCVLYRAVGWSENPGLLVSYGGHDLFSLVEIGLTDLPNTVDATAAPSAPPGTTPLII